MGTTRSALAALALAGVVATGCSSSSNNGGGVDGSTDSPVSKTDSHTGTDGHVNHPDGTPGTDGHVGNPETGPSPEASTDGPCLFETYVVNVIYKAAANSTPNTNLGQKCTDNKTTIPVASL